MLCTPRYPPCVLHVHAPDLTLARMDMRSTPHRKGWYKRVTSLAATRFTGAAVLKSAAKGAR